MRTTASSLSELRSYYTDPQYAEGLRILVNAVSPAEANLAMGALQETMPHKLVVLAANLREVVSALPATPLVMRVDEERLLKALNLERRMALMKMRLPDGLELCVTTAGNMVLDIIVRTNGESHYWNSVPAGDEFVTPAILDLLFESDHLLEAVIELSQGMGLVFNPTFYFSVEDWRMDHAADTMRDMGNFF